MVAINHLHDWASTQSGYRCVIAGCTAMLTQTEVATNKVANTPLDLNHVYKKAGH